eukprot:1431943-Rhodomonas_salina.1
MTPHAARQWACALSVLLSCFLLARASTTISPSGMLQAVPIEDVSHFSRRAVSDEAQNVATKHKLWRSGFSNSNEGHTSGVTGAAEIFNEVALKSSDGELLGSSLAARGDILGLGWGGRGLLSSNAPLKGWFYTVEAGMIGLSSVGFDPMVTSSSEDLSCFGYENGVSCFALNKNRTHTRLTSTDHWVCPPPPSSLLSPAPLLTSLRSPCR